MKDVSFSAFFVFLVLCYHLYDKVFARMAVSESRVIVVVIQDSNEGCACGTTGGRTPVLNHHHQLVTRLLLSVQNSPCTDFT